MEEIDTKICSQCKIAKPLTEFWKSNNRDKGRHSYCKQCGSKYNRHTNPSKKERNKLYRAARKERYHSDAEYREKIKLRVRNYRANHLEQSMLAHSKIRARKNVLDFNIDYSDIFIPEYCPLLGIKLNKTLNRVKGYDTPSIDRIDITKGYVKGNVAVISDLANTMKNSATLEQLRLFASNVESYIQNYCKV